MNAWLIEKADTANPGCTTGLCLGIAYRGKIQNLNWRAEWTTPHFALRFCRKHDAEAAAQVLCPGVVTLATNHSWE